jgi:hypothetical protein
MVKSGKKTWSWAKIAEFLNVSIIGSLSGRSQAF